MVGAADWCVFTQYLLHYLVSLKELAEPLQLAADPCSPLLPGLCYRTATTGALPPLPGSAHSRGSNPPGPTSLWVEVPAEAQPRSHGGR